MSLTANEKAVGVELLHAETRRAVARAIDSLWPDTRNTVGPQCPSVTSYVCRVMANGEEMIAKYSWLGLFPWCPSCGAPAGRGARCWRLSERTSAAEKG